MNKTCTILIPAWHCENYILECIESVKSQQPLEGWTYNLQIAVDACHDTAQVLQRAKIPFHWSQKNVGPYVLRNSLIKMYTSDAYAYFDADDKMLPEYLRRSLMEIELNSDFVMTHKYQCDQNLNKGKVITEPGGAMTFSNDVIDEIGYFQPERCAADTDFINRVNIAAFDTCEILQPLYLRRRHNQSITKSGTHRYGSTARKDAWSRMTAAREAGKIYVEPVTVEFTEPPKFSTQKKREKVTPRRRLFL